MPPPPVLRHALVWANDRWRHMQSQRSHRSSVGCASVALCSPGKTNPDITSISFTGDKLATAGSRLGGTLNSGLPQANLALCRHPQTGLVTLECLLQARLLLVR